MKYINSPRKPRKTMKVTSQTGTITNGHFRLVAKHLLLEVDPENFELITSLAEGCVEVHLLSESEGMEYIAYASGAVYSPAESRIMLRDWTGSSFNGVFEAAGAHREKIMIPTDGSFFRSLDLETDPVLSSYSINEPILSAA